LDKLAVIPGHGLIPVVAVVSMDIPGLITVRTLEAVQVGVLVPPSIIIHPVGNLPVVVAMLVLLILIMELVREVMF
jgi:hypothetical protein